MFIQPAYSFVRHLLYVFKTRADLLDLITIERPDCSDIKFQFVGFILGIFVSPEFFVRRDFPTRLFLSLEPVFDDDLVVGAGEIGELFVKPEKDCRKESPAKAR